MFEIMVREYPNEDPYREALKSTTFPITIFFGMLSMLVFSVIGFWEYVISIWDPRYVEGNKYNPLAPSSVLFFISWFITAKVLKTYFKRTFVEDEIRSYYRINNKHSNKYDTNGRLLWLYFFISPFLIGMLCYYFGWFGVFPLVLSLITIEILIRKEFGINRKK